MISTFALVAGSAATALGADRARRRLILSKAKHPSLAGHVRWGKRIAALIPGNCYDAAEAFRIDGARAEIESARRAGFERLAAYYAQTFPVSRALTAETRSGLSDLQFTGRYRVPFQFADMVSTTLAAGAFWEKSEGPRLTDPDGNGFWDLTGSYGVNVLGNEAYKDLMREGAATGEALGAVLGGLHPIVADNVKRLKAISGLDEVSFHMSGTEAVMQAVRLARYHTGKRHLVRFCGAYHGWWGDVQPGIGNPVPADGTYTLADMSERSLRVLRTRKNIACVLVNPLQALHPNRGAPGDSALVAGRDLAAADRATYAEWLKRLAAVCRERGIVLILDDVFTGFRLAPGGAAEYYGVTPDIVTYGKTLGGGFPVGVVCGKAALMRRFREDRPVDICFARGTFNSHPYVMGAMNAFLRRLEEPATRALYEGQDTRWTARAASLNARLGERDLPLRVTNLASIWTIHYTAPSRYNWMLQYYLRAEGLALSWVGTGRLIFSLDYDDAAFADVADRFVAAALRMRADGWWWFPKGATGKKIGRQLLKEAIRGRLGR
ncbi:aminotransferase class III-fold pyridoxal phosphate-dependent enzyme [Sphingomonas sp.]|uniref:aminotransferase class III-fold pyridoxal phosphate-dependent enzyme n=1 Tax=Sphingomonas sp. TaxID=28214 RepID=UPI000DAF93DA|nr:aminotransferase class III-fold pyridoxal phosphate-dependent enzyme [Sphingomonas sp.]PZU06932.1 MAG: glutamate-1-semialdehyde 2,1-aminomutase [Sphingomonas sp.]